MTLAQRHRIRTANPGELGPSTLLLNPHNAEIFVYKPWRPEGFFNSKSSEMSYLHVAISGSFEYLCYGSTAIRNILILAVRGPSLYVRI